MERITESEINRYCSAAWFYDQFVRADQFDEELGDMVTAYDRRRTNYPPPADTTPMVECRVCHVPTPPNCSRLVRSRVYCSRCLETFSESMIGRHCPRCGAMITRDVQIIRSSGICDDCAISGRHLDIQAEEAAKAGNTSKKTRLLKQAERVCQSNWQWGASPSAVSIRKAEICNVRGKFRD